MKRKFALRRMKLPKDFACAAATRGTRAFEYLNGGLNPYELVKDPELAMVIDDKHPDGGLLYVFTDHSSVVFKPQLN